VVDDYAPVVAGLENDIEEIETQVFARIPEVSQRIYELSREVVEFQRAARPLTAVVNGLTAGSPSTASTRSCSATCATCRTIWSR
jgi:magnesium transporter